MKPEIDLGEMYCPICGNLLGIEGCLVCGYVDVEEDDIEDEDSDDGDTD